MANKQIGACPHDSIEYALGNTYCKACGVWLYAGSFAAPTPPSTQHSAKSVLEEWMREAAKEIWCDPDGAFELPTTMGIEKLRAIIARHSPGWVKIEEGKEETLPHPGKLVLVYTLSGRIDTDAINKHDGLWECDDDWTVTHWMPLPAPRQRND